MRQHTAARKGDGGGWHYVSLSSRGGHPIGACAFHDPHPTEVEARECYAAWQRDRVRLDVVLDDWSGCKATVDGAVCDVPTKGAAEVIGHMGYAVLCDAHRTIEIAIPLLGLDEPAGNAWVS